MAGFHCIAKDGSDNIGIKTERKLEFSTGKPAKITRQGIFQLLIFSNIFYAESINFTSFKHPLIFFTL